ncbi:hypothetical protein [Bacteroides thetaiotaomicron]|nr:hypothetical protein [Bacteroides thetaiotaomicron]
MDYLQLVLSCLNNRAYDKCQVEVGKAKRILEASRLTTSSCNAQP